MSPASSLRLRLLSGGAWALGGKIITALTGLATYALLSRLLSPPEMGFYWLAYSIVLFGGTVGTMGLNNAVVRLIAERMGLNAPGKARRIVNIVFGVIQYALGSVGQILGFIVLIAIFVSGIAVALKRVHDRNRPGWWLVIFYIAPVVLMAVGGFLTIAGLASESMEGIGMIAMIFYIAGGAIAIWAFVELGCLRGTVGPNQYGPDPLENVLIPGRA